MDSGPHGFQPLARNDEQGWGMTFLDRLKGDIVYLRGALRALKATIPIAKNPTRVFPGMIDGLAERFGDAPALLSERESFTYRELAARMNRYARWALAQRLAKGEAVCLLMPNRPEYVAIWLGVTRVGGVAALLNTNLSGPALAHCIDAVRAKHLIVATELFDRLATAEPYLETQPQIWTHGKGSVQFPRIDRAVDLLAAAPLEPSERRDLTVEDKALYIYTSGTTGMPKAANVNHYRILLASLGFSGVMDTRASDRMYDCLPLYHTAGGVVAVGSLLAVGGSVVIREKFSAREFWDDVVRHDCTLFQYIGELCRYLVTAPPSPNERRHRLRLCCGNGLRPDIWDAFKARFAIPLILEFYGATEGNVMLFNFEGKTGAVGRIPWWLTWRFPSRVVKFDVESETPVRTKRGFCLPCGAGEVGETIGRIVNDPERPSNRFEGYAAEKDNEKKILRNVFKTGDAWFRTGDLMRRDAQGHFYFVDRIGDTFRWKGENVSTTEVTETLTRFPGVTDATAYGVHVPGCDGRAGMAAIVCDPRLDLAGLRAHLQKCLPDYARPLFLRIRGEIETTATFKQKKIDLVAQNFDPTGTRDPLYFNDAQAKSFVPLDAALYRRIVAGEVRV
jgi:fatty-acyl-CoA synthase